ncbi:hydroxylamine oxidase [candidate division KSB1 bacterium]|nr:hydroxylamine oxidase [candidate division KSB1 bacterium]
MCVILISCPFVYSDEAEISSETEECIMCHNEMNPGLVESWRQSRHSKITPARGLQKAELERRISSSDIPENLQDISVGCYECHSLNTDTHQDAFEHNGYQINVVVSSNDCATCHSVEADQYSDNLMSHAHGNLVDNALYQDLIKSVNHPLTYENQKLVVGERNLLTEFESCLYCHGSKITVEGTITRETDFGELSFPKLIGWPNQGVGRINPDGSLGACTSCHPRHDFSIETARKPYTCSECHKGPDVPAFKVYEVSKHGNIFSSKSNEFNFDHVPWRVGQDFTAPTCATCHVSLLVSGDDNVISERTHRFNNRLAWRLFGVPYAHPHPVSADLSGVKNSAGLPIATELDSKPVAEFVITPDQQQERNEAMQQICKTCHSAGWVENHFKRIENTIHATNEATLTGTLIISEIWEKGFAEGLPQGKNIFDEQVEREWTSLWLFYTNSTRFASAMTGGGDYGVFANGRYQVTEQLYKLQKWLEIQKMISK